MNTPSTDRKCLRLAVPATDLDDRSYLRLLGRLLAQLGRDEGGKPPAWGDRLAAHWGDEEYVYLEADFPQALDRGADITVHGGRIFIRLEK